MRLLLRTTDPTLIAFAQALLSGEGITAFELDVHMSIIGGSSFLVPRRLMVSQRDHFVARAVLIDNAFPADCLPQ
jgi:hypothetical protein